VRAVKTHDNVVRFPEVKPVSIVPVLPDRLDEALPLALDLLRPAFKRQAANVGEDYLVQDLRDGQSVLWMVYLGDTLTAAFTTVVVTHPLRSVLKIEFLGGADMDRWVGDAIKFLVGVAKHAGLEAIEADGRQGFEKMVKRLPFRPVYTNYVMELS
jgi:hypothetical protein